MKKISFFALLLCVCLILSTTSALAVTDIVTKSGTFEGTQGNADWVLYSDGELVVTGTGVITCSSSSTYDGSKYPWYNYRSQIKKITIGEGITHIGLYMFFGAYNVTSVSFPTTLKSIGDSAFRQCSKLSSLRITNALSYIDDLAFYGCSALTTVELTNVSTIYAYAFESCSNLTTLTLGVGNIYNDAFYNCKKLKNVTFLKQSMSISKSAFAYCTAITNVNFTGTESQWTTIKNNADSSGGNTGLTSAPVTYVKILTLDSNGGDTSVMPVVAPAGSVITIPTDAPVRNGYNFYGWATYQYDTAVAYKVGDTYTLSDNSVLYAVWEQPDGVIAKGKRPNTDMSWILYEDGRLICSGTGTVAADSSYNNDGYMYYEEYIKDVILDEGITALGNRAFYHTLIESITLPDSLTYLGSNALSFTTKLKEITIPDSVETIGTGVLLGSSVETVNLGNPQNDISNLFTACADVYHLTNITVDANNNLYTVQDGVLYTKDMTRLIRVPATKSGRFVIPDTVTAISKFAFSDTKNITELVVPVNLKTVDERVFYGSGLESVYYKGTQEEWDQISVAYSDTSYENRLFLYPDNLYLEYGKTYSISYHANGGTNIPPASEKVKDESYTISEVVPQKDSHIFLGWATTPNAVSAEYQPGDIYTANANTTFYAVWELKEADVDYTSASRWWMFAVMVEGSPTNKTAYVAIYDQYNHFLSCDSYPVVDGVSDLMLTKDSQAKTAKIFVLDNSTTAPYTKSVTIPLN